MRTLCIHPNCYLLSKTRGLCDKHYKQAWQLVQDGKENWATLQAKGLAKKPARQQFPYRTPDHGP